MVESVAENSRAGLPTCVERIRPDASIQAWVQVPQKPQGRAAITDPIRSERRHRNAGSCDRVWLARLQGTDRLSRCGDSSPARQQESALSKTQCAAFAIELAATHKRRRATPGGSSSGSSVAAGMVPVTLELRRLDPCCGQLLLWRDRLQGQLRPSADGRRVVGRSTLGFFTIYRRHVAFWESLGYSTGRTEDFALAAPDPMPEVESAMAVALQNALAHLRAAGVSIRSIDIADMLAKLTDATRTIEFYEGARFHEQRFKEYGTRLADLADLVRDGLQMPVERYDEARRYVAECKTRVAELYKATPVILVPAAPGPAPLGLASTGDGRMNAPWTALGTPAISIPMPVAQGLPLGLQLTADHGQDARVIRTAVRLQQVLSSGTRA